METPETDPSSRIKWFSVKEAAEYLDVGEPTLYRWIRDGKITYRKVGETTRFLREDLEGMVEVFHRVKDTEIVRDQCPAALRLPAPLKPAEPASPGSEPTPTSPNSTI